MNVNVAGNFRSAKLLRNSSVIDNGMTLKSPKKKTNIY